jgi:hypothetical protein
VRKPHSVAMVNLDSFNKSHRTSNFSRLIVLRGVTSRNLRNPFLLLDVCLQGDAGVAYLGHTFKMYYADKFSVADKTHRY